MLTNWRIIIFAGCHYILPLSRTQEGPNLFYHLQKSRVLQEYYILKRKFIEREILGMLNLGLLVQSALQYSSICNPDLHALIAAFDAVLHREGKEKQLNKYRF